MLARDYHAHISVLNVQGHATDAHVLVGIVTERQKIGNTLPDTLAGLGAQMHQMALAAMPT